MNTQAIFVIGIALALTGAVMMFLDVLPLAARITFGIIGVALIAKARRQDEMP